MLKSLDPDSKLRDPKHVRKRTQAIQIVSQLVRLLSVTGGQYPEHTNWIR